MEYNLEKLISSYYKMKESFKDWSIDTSARILFYVPPIGLWEKFVADYETDEVLKSRGLALIVNGFVGRPYGKFREYWAQICKVDDKSNWFRKWMVDTEAGMIAGIVTYPIVAYCSGASLDEIQAAFPFAVTFVGITGRPYGRFLDWWRKRYGGKPVLNK